jgi:hypothetical protein
MTNIDPVDRTPFDLAIETASKNPLQHRRFDERLAKGEDYAKVGQAAAYYCQTDRSI